MAKLGSREHPIIANVHSEALAYRILEDATDLGLKAIVGINLGDPEDIQDYEAAMMSHLREELGATPPSTPPPPPRDPYDPCPCGSGKKYKFCCKTKK
jgi:hypothetical protein